MNAARKLQYEIERKKEEAESLRYAVIRAAARKRADVLTIEDQADLERRALAGENCFDLAIDYLVSVGHVRRLRRWARLRQPKAEK